MEPERDVSRDCGRLLFDESQTRFYKRRKRRAFAFAFLILLFGVFFLLMCILVVLSGHWQQVVVLYGPFTVFTFWWGYILWKVAQSICPLRVYEKGLAPRRMVWFMKKEERDFIPFEKLDRVYINGCFAYQLKGEEHTPWFQFDDLFDLEGFLKSLQGKVEMETDAHIGWDNRITWRVPDDIQVDELGFELQWGEKKRSFRFDDVERPQLMRKTCILILGSGEVFQVEMNRKMLHKLGTGWRMHANGLWKSPTPDEDWWKIIEASK